MKVNKLIVAGLLSLLISPGPVSANSCIVDSNNNGALDVNDTDLGADAADGDDNFRCGKNSVTNPKPKRNMTIAIGTDAFNTKDGAIVIATQSSNDTNSADGPGEPNTVLGSGILSSASQSLILGSQSGIFTGVKPELNDFSDLVGYVNNFLPVADSKGRNNNGSHLISLGSFSRTYGVWLDDKFYGGAVAIGGYSDARQASIAISASTRSLGASQHVPPNQLDTGSIALGSLSISNNGKINIDVDVISDFKGNKIGTFSRMKWPSP